MKPKRRMKGFFDRTRLASTRAESMSMEKKVYLPDFENSQEATNREQRRAIAKEDRRDQKQRRTK